MDDLGTNTAPPLGPHPTLKPSQGSTHRPSQAPPPPLALAQESLDHFEGWETIGEHDSCHEKDFLYPSYNLTSEKLKSRKEEDVVIFDYSLSCVDENPSIQGSGSCSGRFSEGDDIFFQVPKDRLIESKQFNQIINPTKESRPIQSRGLRLAVM